MRASALTSSRPDVRDAETASRQAGSQDVRCDGPACRTSAKPAGAGLLSVASGSTASTVAFQAAADRRRRRDPVPRQRPVDLVGLEQLAGERPERVERLADARVAFLRAVAEPDDPAAAVAQVIARFLGAFAAIAARRVSSKQRAPRRGRAARRRTGTAARWCGRSRRSAARPASGSGTRIPRAGTRARPHRGRGPRAPRRSASSSRAWPIRSSAMFARPRSSSSAGAWPTHSPSRCASTRLRVGEPQHVARAVRRSQRLHLVRDVVERRVAIDLVAGRLEQRIRLARIRRDDVARAAPTQMLTPSWRRV